MSDLPTPEQNYSKLSYWFPLFEKQPVVRIPVAGPAPFNTLAVVRTEASGMLHSNAPGQLLRWRSTTETPLVLAGYDPRRPEQQHVVHSSSATLHMMQTSDGTDFVHAVDAVVAESTINEDGRWMVSIDSAAEAGKVTAATGVEISSWVLCFEPPLVGEPPTGRPSTGSVTTSGLDPIKVVNQLRQRSVELVVAERLPQAADAIEAALEVLRGYSPAASGAADYQWLLVFVLLDRFRLLLTMQRVEEAHGAALEAIQAYREVAATPGADVAGVGSSLLSFSSYLASAGLHPESIAAAQGAVDLLREVQPPPQALLTHRQVLAQALHVLVQHLIAAGRIDQAHGAALEAIQAYREVAATPGADVAGVGSSLLSFSSYLASAGLHPESIAAAQASADLLHQ
jgi:hypothetical protein